MENNIIDKVWATIDRIGLKIEELSEEHKKTELAQKQTEKMIKELSTNIGGLNNSFGEFTEAIFLNSLEKIMFDNLNVDIFERNISRKKRNVGGVEIDALGINNGIRNEAFITEIKTKFSTKHLKQLEETLSKFNNYFPEYSNKTKYGVLAVLSLSEKHKNEILKAGFYPISIKDDLAVYDIPKNFKPKAYN